MIKFLKNKEGSAAIYAVVIILVLLMIFTVVSEYLRLQIIAKGVKDATQTAVISVATQNYDDVYNGLREGYAGGYELSGSNTWIEKVDTGAVMSELSELLGLIDGKRVKENETEYTLSNLGIIIINPPIAPSGEAQKFEALVTMTLTVPLSYGWEHLPPMVINLQVKAGYTPKF